MYNDLFTIGRITIHGRAAGDRLYAGARRGQQYQPAAWRQEDRGGPEIRLHQFLFVHFARRCCHVSLSIERGEFAAVIGHSGSGKSTLMNILGCLDTPTEGDYLLNGVQVASMSDNELARVRNQEIGFVFQGFNLIANLNALENVELPLIYRGIDKKDRREMAEKALDMFYPES